MFRSTKFCQSSPNFKDAVAEAGQIFVRREIWQICQFKRRDSKENVNQENLISIFSRSTAKIKSIFARRWNQTWKIRTSVCSMTIRWDSTTITVPKSTDQALLSLYIRMFTWVSRVQVQVQVSRLHVIKLKAAKLIDTYIWPRFSAPTLDKLKIWQGQILSRFLEGPNKFCQSSASGP